MNKYAAFIFDDNNTITTADIAPEISVDMAYGLKDSVRKLREALGVTTMRKMDKGATIKIYKTTKVNAPEQVAEGEVVPLTKFQRKLAQTVAAAGDFLQVCQARNIETGQMVSPHIKD